jgi:hypothetical protein
MRCEHRGARVLALGPPISPLSRATKRSPLRPNNESLVDKLSLPAPTLILNLNVVTYQYSNNMRHLLCSIFFEMGRRGPVTSGGARTNEAKRYCLRFRRQLRATERGISAQRRRRSGRRAGLLLESIAATNPDKL